MFNKNKYYSLNEILKRNADYNVIFGERSNGKTYAALEYGLKQYITHGKQMAYIRRWREDLRGKRAESLFNGHVQNGLIAKITKNKYDTVYYYSNKFFLAKRDEKAKKVIPDSTPFAYCFALSEQEHDKSTSFPNVTTIIFDEFLTRRYYLVDEFVLFMNLLSTIIRQRDDVKIFMLGNTVNQYCPYFSEMGLTHVRKQLQGTIDMYTFGSNTTVAVEYTASTASGKDSNRYFAFDNPQLQMITNGAWELALYPHLPHKYTPQDVLFVYYIVYQDTTLQANIIQIEDDVFTYIHLKTTPIKDKYATVYSLNDNSSPLYHVRLLRGSTEIERKIALQFATNKVFYQNNEVGEVVRNYIMQSEKKTII